MRILDTGPGIPPELQSQIYKMHFTTKSGGTGIGLYVARSVVESHGGEIRVETAAGRGHMFSDIPAARSRKGPRPLMPHALVVEDDPHSLSALAEWSSWKGSHRHRQHAARRARRCSPSTCPTWCSSI